MADPEQLARLKKGAAEWNRWREIDLTLPDLSGADLGGADLIRANLNHANVSRANLERAHIQQAQLKQADLSGARLMQASLYEARLFQAQLIQADLSGADLTRADLNMANLNGANLTGANLKEAKLMRANLTGADLTQADLTVAYLIMTNFMAANLTEANLEMANVGGTLFAAIDLSQTKGLDHVRHGGPSTIGVDTLFRSNGSLPESFLRGAGVPDALITYVTSLATTPLQFYSCFISYSTQDQTFADRLHADLQSNGVRCWFAPHDIRAGKKIHEQIDEAIRLYDKLLLILSPASIASEWVNTEIAKARKRELSDHRRMLFPVRLVDFETLRNWECFDADTGKDSAREIREYFIPDFSQWKTAHDAYARAFDRLLKDLQTERPAGV